jgi:adenosylhomocysteine nucleosidase
MLKDFKIAIIGAMDEEIESLKPQIENCVETQVAGFNFFAGSINGQEIILLQSGIGKVNAAVGTTILIEQFKPDYVINTGSAGGFDQSLNVGDVVISNEVCYHDVDVTAFDYVMGQVPQMPARFKADEELIKVAQELDTLKQVNTVTGLISTGDVFMNDPKRVEETRKHFPTMQACEMEAAAIAQTCFRYNIPFIIFRSLSDIAGKESNISFPEYVKVAGVHSAKMAVELITKLKELKA